MRDEVPHRCRPRPRVGAPPSLSGNDVVPGATRGALREGTLRLCRRDDVVTRRQTGMWRAQPAVNRSHLLWGFDSLSTHLARLAQPARAPRSHRGGHRFEPCGAHRAPHRHPYCLRVMTAGGAGGWVPPPPAVCRCDAEWGSEVVPAGLMSRRPSVRIRPPQPAAGAHPVHAPVAQRIERPTTDRKAGGSNPSGRAGRHGDPPPCEGPCGGTGRHIAFRARRPSGVRVRLPLGAPRRHCPGGGTGRRTSLRGWCPHGRPGSTPGRGTQRTLPSWWNWQTHHAQNVAPTGCAGSTPAEGTTPTPRRGTGPVPSRASAPTSEGTRGEEAQLEVRLLCKQEVVGSSPAFSTPGPRKWPCRPARAHARECTWSAFRPRDLAAQDAGFSSLSRRFESGWGYPTTPPSDVNPPPWRVLGTKPS